MTLQQIRYFVTVGRTLNYTQASRELFVSQSAVSKQIQGLEQELQLQLFRRDHHSVALTPAGEFLYQKFREILVQMEDALEQARSAASASQAQFRLGILPFLDISRIAPGVFDDFGKICPSCHLNVESYPLEELLDHFYQKQVDAVLVRTFDMVKGRSVVRYPLSRGKTHIYFSSKLFSGRRDLDCLQAMDFQGKTIFLQSTNNSNYQRPASPEFVRNYGFQPREVQYVTTWEDILSKVHMGYGVTIAGPSFWISREKSLHCVPVEGSRADCGIDAVWYQDGENFYLPAFQKVISNLALSKHF